MKPPDGHNKHPKQERTETRSLRQMKWSLGHKMPSLLHVVKLSMHTMHVMHVAGNAEDDDDDDEDDAAFISFREVDDANLMNHVEPALCERTGDLFNSVPFRK